MKPNKSFGLAVAVSVLSLSLVSGTALARGGFGGGYQGFGGGYQGMPRMGGTGMLEQLDTNADGLVTVDEFTSARTSRSEQRFDRLDQDDDGTVSAEEFQSAPVGRGFRGGVGVDQAALQQCMEDQGVAYVGRPTWDELLTAADTSGDGAIDQNEFLAHQQAKGEDRFTTLDVNSDGVLDEAELDTASSMMQEQRDARRTCFMEQRQVNGVLAF